MEGVFDFYVATFTTTKLPPPKGGFVVTIKHRTREFTIGVLTKGLTDDHLLSLGLDIIMRLFPPNTRVKIHTLSRPLYEAWYRSTPVERKTGIQPVSKRDSFVWRHVLRYKNIHRLDVALHQAGSIGSDLVALKHQAADVLFNTLRQKVTLAYAVIPLEYTGDLERLKDHIHAESGYRAKNLQIAPSVHSDGGLGYYPSGIFEALKAPRPCEISRKDPVKSDVYSRVDSLLEAQQPPNKQPARSGQFKKKVKKRR